MDQDIRIAMIVNPALPLGLLSNTVSAVSIGLGAKFPFLAGDRLKDRNGLEVDISSNRPVPVLQADPDALREIMMKATKEPASCAVVIYPAFARSLHSYSDYEAEFPNRDLSGEIIDGIGLAGPAKWVKSLTGSLKLLR
nr:DUF2000 domain-containing protein [Brucella intermedia]